MNIKLGYLTIILLLILTSIQCKRTENTIFEKSFHYSMSKEVLLDKIKGGWAGQVIGCTYGGPTEFKHMGTIINDYTPILWNENRILWYYENYPVLYDDVYMDLTFVDVFEKEGLEAPAEIHAKAFAYADYRLWHANQVARYNILKGIMPPESGHWKNNPHSDDIDFQIEADFAGLMSPGMINLSTEYCDRIGHIMNYGDGFYGGVFIAGMYSMAFVSDDIGHIITEALKLIPEESAFFKLINDVINWHSKYPDNWKETWWQCQKNWSEDIGCPDGIFKPFNIDAKMNSAYVVIGLLYGDGDFGKTIDIATRCGQDSDCNPASAAGILATIQGYSKIPDYWRKGLEKVEDLNFPYFNISLNDAYKLSFNHSLKNIKNNDGIIKTDSVIMAIQHPVPVSLEQGFDDNYPVGRTIYNVTLGTVNDEFKFDFKGKGFIIKGGARKTSNNLPDKDVIVDVYIDGELFESSVLPTSFIKRKPDISWKYDLENTDHQVSVKYQKPGKGYEVVIRDIIFYGDKSTQGK